jgi:hypothetical protein
MKACGHESLEDRVYIKKTPFFLQKKLTTALSELQGWVKWTRRSHHLVVTYRV